MKVGFNLKRADLQVSWVQGADILYIIIYRVYMNIYIYIYIYTINDVIWVVPKIVTYSIYDVCILWYIRIHTHIKNSMLFKVICKT